MAERPAYAPDADICDLLAEGPLSTSVIAERLTMSPRTVRHRLHVLRAAGLIVSEPYGHHLVGEPYRAALAGPGHPLATGDPEVLAAPGLAGLAAGDPEVLAAPGHALAPGDPGVLAGPGHALATGDPGVLAAAGNPADRSSDAGGPGPAFWVLAVSGLGLAVVAVFMHLTPAPPAPVRGSDALNDLWRFGPW